MAIISNKRIVRSVLSIPISALKKPLMVAIGEALYICGCVLLSFPQTRRTDMNELTVGQTIALFFLGGSFLLILISPWFALNCLRDIAKELKEIRNIMEREAWGK